jgi:DNA (cytosine-5)-methyltransferase 1
MLYFWMREFIAVVKPKVFYAENVKGLVSLGDAKEIIAHDFSSINGSSYFVLPVKVLKAINFGIPQTRERVIFIGINKDYLRASVKKHIEEFGNLPEGLDLYPTPSHGNVDLLDTELRQVATSKSAFEGLVEPELSNDLSQQAFSKAKHFAKKMQGGAEVVLTKPGPTIRAEHHGNIEFRRLSAANGGKNTEELAASLPQRRLTVRECARLQTFPDNYEFVIPEALSASDGYRLIGNAVPPLLAYRLAERLQEVWDQIFIK